jgi:nitrite reductase/ring-hydroxylating ferredoxin subunit
MPFEPIIADAELWDGDMTARRVNGHDLLLVRHNGVVYAYENRCSIRGGAVRRPEPSFPSDRSS